MIDATRILERIDALARCSEDPGALTRVFMSPQQRQASELVLSWMNGAGMSARVDAIGNVVGRYEGEQPSRPCLMLGSHLDTVRRAGKFDGMLGVIAAIECVQSLHDRGRRLPFAVEVVGFADEEGVRYGTTFLGSKAIAGTFDLGVLRIADAQGIAMRDALAANGFDAAAIPSAARRRDDILAYCELHIEQGPVLEAESLPVGTVTAINGMSRLAVRIEGMAGHAGTVPMGLRRDALAAAAECVLGIERIAGGLPEVVATVGRIEALPGAINVVPGEVRFTIDTRAPRDELRGHAVAAIKQHCAEVAARRGVGIAIELTQEAGVAACAPWLMDQIDAAIAAQSIPVRRLPSGAGHDGMAMKAIADIGMLFVRCKGGISHNPAEDITAADADVSTQIFLRFIENFRPRTPAAAGANRPRGSS
jgi:allantoate deiminase